MIIVNYLKFENVYLHIIPILDKLHDLLLLNESSEYYVYELFVHINPHINVLNRLFSFEFMHWKKIIKF